MKPIRHILVPIDFSEASDAAFALAKDLAQRLDARIHLLHVVPLPTLYGPWGAGQSAAAMPLHEILEESEQLAERRLKQAVPGPRRAHKTTRVKTVVGVAVHEILRYVRTHKIDLVVMGTHGRGLVGHLLLGSVAERVVRKSPVPVLTVRGDKTRRARRTGSRRKR